MIVMYKPAKCPLLPDPFSWVFNGAKLKCFMQLPEDGQVNVGNIVKTVPGAV